MTWSEGMRVNFFLAVPKPTMKGKKADKEWSDQMEWNDIFLHLFHLRFGEDRKRRRKRTSFVTAGKNCWPAEGQDFSLHLPSLRSVIRHLIVCFMDFQNYRIFMSLGTPECRSRRWNERGKDEDRNGDMMPSYHLTRVLDPQPNEESGKDERGMERGRDGE